MHHGFDETAGLFTVSCHCHHLSSPYLASRLGTMPCGSGRNSFNHPMMISVFRWVDNQNEPVDSIHANVRTNGFTKFLYSTHRDSCTRPLSVSPTEPRRSAPLFHPLPPNNFHNDCFAKRHVACAERLANILLATSDLYMTYQVT